METNTRNWQPRGLANGSGVLGGEAGSCLTEAEKVYTEMLLALPLFLTSHSQGLCAVHLQLARTKNPAQAAVGGRRYRL